MTQSLLLIAQQKETRQQYLDDFCDQKEIGKFDRIVIQPEENSFGIAQVRSAQKSAFRKPLHGQEKILIFEDAQLLTVDAQNALLKLLEEPPRHTYMVLSAQVLQPFLPTIVSRCKIVTIKAPLPKLSDEEKQKITQIVKSIQEGSIGEKLALAETLSAQKETLPAFVDQLMLHARETMLAQPTHASHMHLLQTLQEVRITLQTTNVSPRVILEHAFLKMPLPS